MIVAISASGRKGSNSTLLLKKAVEGTGLGPDEVKVFNLAAMTFKGCTGCAACRKGSTSCVLNDDLIEVLDVVSRADALILASPNYYGYVSGIFKSFIDRWYSFRDGDRQLRIPEGRKLLFLHSQGHPDEKAYETMLGSMEKIFSGYGFVTDIVVGAGLEKPESVLEIPSLTEAAFKAGARLVTG